MSPENYTSLFGWITYVWPTYLLRLTESVFRSFSWVYPLIQRVSSLVGVFFSILKLCRVLTPHLERKIFGFSVLPHNQRQFLPSFTACSWLPRHSSDSDLFLLRSATLLRRIWDANSLDILLDFLGTLGSVVSAYSSTFFLKYFFHSSHRHY